MLSTLLLPLLSDRGTEDRLIWEEWGRGNRRTLGTRPMLGGVGASLAGRPPVMGHREPPTRDPEQSGKRCSASPFTSNGKTLTEMTLS